MSIKVKIFASMAETLGFRETQCEHQSGMTARVVWNTITQGREPPRNMIVAINHDYSRLDAVVGDGDEVGFFPPVTGG